MAAWRDSYKREHSWDRAYVEFRIRNHEHAHDVGLCDELPLGWVVCDAQPEPHSPFRTPYYVLTFQVQGDVLERDGAIVRRILERLGCF